MAGLKFSSKGVAAEAAKNILKAYLLANGCDDLTATMFGAFLSETIKGFSIEKEQAVFDGIDAAIKDAWVDVLSMEEFECLGEECKTDLKQKIISSQNVFEVLSADNPESELRKRIIAALKPYTDCNAVDLNEYARYATGKMLDAINKEIESDGILTLLKEIKKLQKDGRDRTDTLEDVFSPAKPSEEWLCDWLVKTCELIDKCRPMILYFDTWIQNEAFKPYLKKVCAYYYNRAEEWGKEVTINYKHNAFPPTVATFDVERGALTDISPVPWQTDTAIGRKSWGYITDNEFKPSRQIICDLVDIVSKNGMLLINVGPKPDGTITDEETAVLEEIGEWMNINGEGIYGTMPWQVFGEGEVNNEAGSFQDNDEKNFTSKDFRFTYKNGFIYAFCMRPDSEKFLLTSLKIRGERDVILSSAEALGDYDIVDSVRDEDGLHLTLNRKPSSDKPVCFKIGLA